MCSKVETVYWGGTFIALQKVGFGEEIKIAQQQQLVVKILLITFHIKNKEAKKEQAQRK